MAHCYALLCFKDDQLKKTYIGKTTDLKRRLRQHNGEISGGAKATKGYNCKFLFTVSGFPTERDALRFEWAMKHPTGHRKSKRGRGSTGCQNALKRTLQKFSEWDYLTVNHS